MRRLYQTITCIFMSMLAQAQSFEEVSLPGITDVPTASRSANFIDVNGDGWDDIFITNGPFSGQNNMLFLNDQDNTFTTVTGEAIVQDNDRSDGASFADADNDGDVDAFVVTFGANGQGKKNYFYRNNGDGSFMYEPNIAMGIPLTYSEMANWIDINNDQNLDLYVTNSVGNLKNMYFENQGDMSFEQVTNLIITDEVRPSRSINWVDYDQDGDNDLFVTNEGNSRNALYRNDGANGFTQIFNLVIVDQIRSSAGSSWGDIDNDGDFDLFVANYGNNGQSNQLFINNNGSFTEDTTSIIGTPITNSFGSSFGDLDNDGDLDLIVCNSFLAGQNTNFIYINDGSGNFTLDTTSSLATHQGWTFGCAFGDYDNNGWLDVLLANTINENETNSLYRNTGSGNNWTKINLEGVASNTSAVGAEISLTSTINGQEITQTRHVSAASGYCSQNSYSVHFGLGNSTIIDKISIEWPSGLSEFYTDVSINTINNYLEGEGTLSIDEVTSTALFVYPNPVEDTLHIIGLEIPDILQNLRVEMYTIDGRLIHEEIMSNDLQTPIDVSELASGTYIYTIIRENKQMHSGQFIKR
ncbi:FG-GAP-like repeat-containing protein [Dokdonia sp.]|uniref:FG-GAP-like repeat-containing protein n=1 Tax=Dokdonia sp. TaxID=2024995 RepID=UPI003263465D